MPRIFQEWDATLLIGNRELPVFNFSIDAGTYGQIDRATARTTVSTLWGNEINIDALNGAAGRGIRIPVQLRFNGDLKFGGTFLHGFFSFHDDEVELAMRAYSGILFDTKRSLSDLNYQNQRVSQLVRQIGAQFHIPTDIHLDDDPPVGTVVDQAQGAIMATYPQPLWNLLVYLARMIGANVRTTPQGHLVFEDIPEDPVRHQYVWMPPPAGNTGVNPLGPTPFSNPDSGCLKLEVLWQPERNKNFSVIVISHHGQSTITAVQHVTVAGEDIEIGHNTVARQGYYKGAAGRNLRNALSNQGLGIPVYLIRKQGLTPAAAQDLALAKAQEIASRLYVYTTIVDGNPEISPLDRLIVTEHEPGSMLGFSGKQLYITSVTNHWIIPQGEMFGGNGEGYVTTIKALNLPPLAGATDPGEIAAALN